MVVVAGSVPQDSAGECVECKRCLFLVETETLFKELKSFQKSHFALNPMRKFSFQPMSVSPQVSAVNLVSVLIKRSAVANQ